MLFQPDMHLRVLLSPQSRAFLSEISGVRIRKKFARIVRHVRTRDTVTGCASEAPSTSGSALPEALVQARRVQTWGLALSGALFVGGLALAVAQDVQLPQLPAWLPWLLLGFPPAAAAALAAAKALMGESLQLEVHNNRVYVQWGAPFSGPPLAPNAIQVRPTGDVRGNGAFALVDIPQGTHIGNYEGDLLDEAAYWARYPCGVSDYCMRIDKEWTIDAAERARDTEAFSVCHLNHSAARHNVVRSVNRAQQRVSSFAERDIQAGEELLLDYGKVYWKGREHLELD